MLECIFKINFSKYIISYPHLIPLYIRRSFSGSGYVGCGILVGNLSKPNNVIFHSLDFNTIECPLGNLLQILLIKYKSCWRFIYVSFIYFQFDFHYRSTRFLTDCLVGYADSVYLIPIVSAVLKIFRETKDSNLSMFLQIVNFSFKFTSY